VLQRSLSGQPGGLTTLNWATYEQWYQGNAAGRGASVSKFAGELVTSSLHMMLFDRTHMTVLNCTGSRGHQCTSVILAQWLSGSMTQWLMKGLGPHAHARCALANAQHVGRRSSARLGFPVAGHMLLLHAGASRVGVADELESDADACASIGRSEVLRWHLPGLSLTFASASRPCR